jgi:hypothetical protein
VIVWINGAFGAGKSTTAGLLLESLEGARLFDPEYVGYLLQRFVPVPTGDFQDLPLWRTLTVQTLAGLDREHPGTWVVPMTLVNGGYRAEIHGGLRRLGHWPGASRTPTRSTRAGRRTRSSRTSLST